MMNEVNEPIYDAIYLSPHLDDAVLSCGGCIFQQTQAGKMVLIITFTAKKAPIENLSPFAQQLHDTWKLGTLAVQHRRDEDMLACQIVGANGMRRSNFDCIYRRHPETGLPLYNNEAELFGGVHAGDTQLIEEMVVQMEGLPPAKSVFAPLGIGNHVDHQLVRQVAEIVFPELSYYEDYPYVSRAENEAAWAEKRAGLQPEIVSLSAAAKATRIEAIGAYQSQIDSLFGSMEQMALDVSQTVAKTGGERYWHPIRR